MVTNPLTPVFSSDLLGLVERPPYRQVFGVSSQRGLVARLQMSSLSSWIKNSGPRFRTSKARTVRLPVEPKT